MRRIVEDGEIIFTDNYGRFVYSTLFIDWTKEVGGYTGKAMQIADEVAQWQAANSNIPGMSPEDVLQELRIHIWKRIPKYDASIGSVRWYAQFIFQTKKIDLKRASERHKRKALNTSQPLCE